MTTMTQATHADPVQSLLRRIKLLGPTFSHWHGAYQIPGAKVSLEGQTLDEDKTTRPQVKLLEQNDELKTYKQRFNTLISSLNSAKTFYSEPFPLQGVRQIPATAVEAFLYEVIGKTDDNGNPIFDDARVVPRNNSTLQSVAYRLNDVADEFARHWPRMRSELEQIVDPTLWASIKHKIPSTSSTMRSKFSFDVSLVELAVGESGIETEAVDGKQLKSFNAYVRTSLQRQVGTAIEQLVAGPRDALATALRSLNELILRNGNVTEKSFRPVREAIAKLRLFDFAADRSILDSISQLERRMGSTVAVELDATTANDTGFLSLTNSVIRTAEDGMSREAAAARFGKASRAVML